MKTNEYKSFTRHIDSNFSAFIKNARNTNTEFLNNLSHYCGRLLASKAMGLCATGSSLLKHVYGI